MLLRARALIVIPLKACLFLMFFLSAGTFQLLREGAVSELFESEVKKYSGPLNYIFPSWVAVTVVLTIMATLRYRGMLKLCKSELPLFLVLFYACLTLIWSDFPYNAARSLSFLIASFCLLFVAVRLLSFDQFRDLFINSLLCMQLATIVFVFFLPAYGVSVGEHEGKWQGVFGHKNALGNFSAMAYCIFLGDMCRAKTFKALLGIFISLIITIHTLSYTGVAIIPIATVAYAFFCFGFSLRSLLWLRALLILFVAALCFILVSISINGISFEVLGKDTSFSNRNIIWAFFWDRAMERPVLGYGVDQLGGQARLHYEDYKSEMGFVVGSAHNGFIENFFWFGVVGVFIIFLLFWRFFRFNKIGWVISLNSLFLISLILTNTFESRLVGFNIHFVSFMYLYFIGCSSSFGYSEGCD